jgi:hypothetical protein
MVVLRSPLLLMMSVDTFESAVVTAAYRVSEDSASVQ